MRKESITRQRFNEWLEGKALEGAQSDLWADVPASAVPVPAALRGPAYAISCFRSETRWTFLDRVRARWEKEGTTFLTDPADPDAREWTLRLKAIRRDVHKAHAFVRFKKIHSEQGEIFVAGHRPQHDTLDLFTRLFCRRFPNIRWAILTHEESAHFIAGTLAFGDGHPGQFPELDDDWENTWRTYYASIYNPSRLMISAMKKELPMHHWQTLPESRLIPDLIRRSGASLATMRQKAQATAENFLPGPEASLAELMGALPACEGCRLHAHCRPTPGAGFAKASLVLVGEQPGDEEEKRGEPFVGPAGQVLRDAVARAGIDWSKLYVTNAVKHFKYEYQGPYRLHKRPDRDEVAACRPWFQREMSLVQPKVVLCLGSTAALSVSGRLWPVESYRGTRLPSSSPFEVRLTYHPAAILRAPAAKQALYHEDLVRDLHAAMAAAVG